MSKVVCTQCETAFEPDSKNRCPNCGKPCPEQKDPDTKTGFEQDEHIPEEEEEKVPQILLEYRHLKLERAQHGIIPLRLTNLNDFPIREINFLAESPAFLEEKERVKERINKPMAQGASTDQISCEFKIAERTGPYNVKIIIVAVDDHGKRSVFSGRLHLFIRSEGYQPPKIDLSDTRIIGSDIDVEGAQVAFSQNRIVGSNITIKSPKESFFGENTDWLKVSIEFDLEKTRIITEKYRDSNKPRPAPASKPKPKPGAGFPKAMLSYKVPGTDLPKMVHIRSGHTFSFGRLNQSSDIVAIRLPNTPENQIKNDYISGAHCKLSIASFTDVFLQDLNSMNGTYLNGKQIKTRTGVKHHDVINLARVLSFKYYTFRDFSSVHSLNRNFGNCRTAMDCTTALSEIDTDEIRLKSPLDAILLRRTDAFKERLEYLIIVRSAEIGSGVTVPVMIRHDSIDPTHARFIFDGQYYIEDLNSSQGTFINETRLTPFNRVPLKGGEEIRLGQVIVTFREIA